MSALQPIVGVDMWEKTGYIPPLPPNFGKKRGIPSKARRGLDEEPSGGSKNKKTMGVSLPKQQHSAQCSWCKKPGHNALTCEWKLFAEEFPIDHPMEEVNEQQEVAKHVDEETHPNEEWTQLADAPSVTQESQDNVDQTPVPNCWTL